ncbi:hypothetical protein TNCV_4990891 [Trichonephila clavipes]|nr:hypothetical protein TNCV_4990891 [Trichonephila clavipes]
MRMSSHERLEDSLRKSVFGRLEAGQSQVKVAWWLQVPPKLLFWLCNQLKTSGTFSRKVTKGQRHLCGIATRH